MAEAASVNWVSTDQWQPIHNANGTWSFYNRNSQLALTVASGANGATLVQKPQHNRLPAIHPHQQVTQAA